MVDLDSLRDYFDRTIPMLPELFNIAHAICGNAQAAEYALMYALMELWMSESRGNPGLREGLRNEIREVALEESGGECTWTGAEFALDPLLGRENARMRRMIVLRYGCNLSCALIGRLFQQSASAVRRQLARFLMRWASAEQIPERQAEAALTRRIRRQMLTPSPSMPATEAIYRALAEEAVQTARPRHIVSRMLRRVAAGVLIALCALLFWLIGVLIYPVG